MRFYNYCDKLCANWYCETPVKPMRLISDYRMLANGTVICNNCYEKELDYKECKYS